MYLFVDVIDTYEFVIATDQYHPQSFHPLYATVAHMQGLELIPRFPSFCQTPVEFFSCSIRSGCAGISL